MKGEKKVPKDRKIDRHRPGYFRDYMRKYRERLKLAAGKSAAGG